MDDRDLNMIAGTLFLVAAAMLFASWVLS